MIGDASTCVVLNVCCNGSAEHLEVISNNTSKREAAAVLIDGNGNVSDVVTGGANGTVHMRNFATLTTASSAHARRTERPYSRTSAPAYRRCGSTT